MPTSPITIPRDLLPADGRFGCGPSKIRQQSIDALAAAAPTLLGTSHRQEPVRQLVGRMRAGLRELFELPDGYEVLLGNGGTTVFWDAATFGLIRKKSQHVSYGEFSARFAQAASAAPHLDAPTIIKAAPGTRSRAVAQADVDTYCLVHNETSTGVIAPVERPAGTAATNDELVLVDATSAAGGLPVRANEYDCYYFAPQKCFASDGGLWIALCSDAAIARMESIKQSGRWQPASLDITIARTNSNLDQTYNTPALATLFLFGEQITWILDNGGLAWANARCAESATILYGWAERSSYAQPFVASPDERSPVVGTIDLIGVDAEAVITVLRANGIIDTDGYRKLGRNQLRVGMFPAVEPADVQALTGCIDYVVERLTTPADFRGPPDALL